MEQAKKNAIGLRKLIESWEKRDAAYAADAATNGAFNAEIVSTEIRVRRDERRVVELLLSKPAILLPCGCERWFLDSVESNHDGHTVLKEQVVTAGRRAIQALTNLEKLLLVDGVEKMVEKLLVNHDEPMSKDETILDRAWCEANDSFERFFKTLGHTTDCKKGGHQ